jgi:hypothetical protein
LILFRFNQITGTGTLSANGATGPASTGALDRAFLAALFMDRQATLGGAVHAAAQRFLAGGGDEATLLTYNLLGDPALRLRRTD